MMIRPRGADVLRDPRQNKFTGFTQAERVALGLEGLLPQRIEGLDVQLRRVVMQLEQRTSPLEKYLYLSELQEIDETLFYKVLTSYPAQLLPFVYTPTVGDACLQFSYIMRRPKGLYVSINRKGHLREILRNWPQRDVRFIVVTSGERILGLGDLGADGMGIPIGKLALYTACAGVPPQLSIPIMMDCGTNNDKLLQDPLYTGLRQPRPSVINLDSFVEEFVTAVQEEFPDCCIQFEDWGRPDAFRLLARYRDRVCCFNDDIQGSGAVVLAGILSALRITGGGLIDQTFLFLGAGSAGVGVANLLTRLMIEEGISAEQARSRIWLFNRNGLVESGRDDLTDFQRPYAHHHTSTKSFVAAIEALQPTMIVGLSTLAKAFSRSVIETMARINRRPIIFALSNPTSRSECTAEEAYQWSSGRAVFASGSPFAPMQYGNQRLVPGQCNNLYIFPAMGLAIYATRAKRVTDEMFLAAAHALAERVTPADLETGLVYPPQSAIFETEMHVARRIAEVIFARDLARVEKPQDLDAFIHSQVYKPEYRSLID
ncbi:MAG TPA: NAD-dependent malic enzyme [Candidatus Binataceae bacterium]|nr:NAD-dependent malic enzyme [Candidatus Binataceae bacterium]